MDAFGWMMALPPGASALALAWLCITGSRRALHAAWWTSLAALFLWGYFAWVFRDGLIFGPHTSHGMTALLRFWARFQTPLAAWLVFIAIAHGLRWRRGRSARRGPQADTGQNPRR